jgi:hypothetical protein
MTLRIEPAATGLRPRPVPTPARCGQLPNPPLPRGAGVDRCLPRRRREPGSDSRLVDLSSGTGPNGGNVAVAIVGCRSMDRHHSSRPASPLGRLALPRSSMNRRRWKIPLREGDRVLGLRRHRQHRLLLPPGWSTRAIGDRGHRG